MSTPLEQQTDEREALQSIYEGDENFKEINTTTFHYKYGVEDDFKSFLVELQWGENYPDEAPIINMNSFYNRNLLPAVKAEIQDALSNEATQWLGCGMTYTLFEYIKDNIDRLTAAQPESAPSYVLPDDVVAAIKISDNTGSDASKKKEPKKEQLTKAQKRRQWDRTDHKGDRPRGYEWVDIIKHLSQTSNKDYSESATSTTTATTATDHQTAASQLSHPLNS